MKPTPHDEAARWLAQARQDLSDGRYNADGDRHHLACFLAQQSAEKGLKAYLYARGIENPWGHSAAQLCEAAREFDTAFAELTEAASTLDRYYIPTRYPNGLPGGTPADAFHQRDSESALADAEKVVEFVSNRVEGR